MTTRALSLVLLALLLPVSASAQIIESAGERALGMGGAFVAVADDSSATWWNPAGQASGPFVDVSLGHASTNVTNGLPAGREQMSWFTLATPPLGFGYYHFRAARAGAPAPTAAAGPGRQEDGTGVPFQSLSVHQFGGTVVQSVLPGVHVGATVKYLRGTLQTGAGAPTTSASGLLDAADDLSGRTGSGHVDLDIGVLAVEGALRLGAVVRNTTAPTFANATPGLPSMTLPRQVRAGAAFDVENTGASLPLTVSVDADLRAYATATGDRRVVAVGAEEWLASKRLGLRGGARFNTVGLQERAATGGISVAVRSGALIEAHVVGGGSRDERGWGVGARVSF